MKVMDINVEFGYILPPLLRLIESEKPDILCAQEVLQSQQKIALSDNYQTLTHIKEAGEFEQVFFSPTWGFEAFGTHMDMGNAIFSKFPLSKKETRFINGDYTPKQTAEGFDYNIRNLQVCEAQTPAGKIFIANHQGFLEAKNPMGSEETTVYTQKVADHLNTYAKSLIFCADLNVVKESPAFKPIGGLGLRNLTADNGLKTTLSEVHRAPNRNEIACDYIFVSPNVKTKAFSVSDTIVSDHKALILEFDL